MTKLFESVFLVSVTTTLVILPLKLCSYRINRSYVVRWKYWAWLLLALRLLIPWNPSLPVQPVQVEIPPQMTETVTVKALENAVQIRNNTQLTGVTVVGVPAVSPANISFQMPSPLDILALVWAIGTILFLVFQIIGYLRFRHQLLRWGRSVNEGTVFDLLRKEAAEMGASLPKLLISSAAPGPMMIGFLHPTLVLPEENFPEASLTLILRHELTHHKRGDLWYKLLMLLANAVHWFNPAVWMMASEAGNDLELSCDHLVIRSLDAQGKRLYSETILESIRMQQKKSSPLSTGFQGGVSTMKERFRNILESRKLKNGRIAFLTVLLCAGMLGGMVSCSRNTAHHTIFAPNFEDGKAVTLSVQLPEGWSLALAQDNSYHEVRNAVGEVVGSVTFERFQWYPEADSYLAVYNSIMLGSMASWDNEYTPVKTTEYTETATCRPWYKLPEEGKSMAEIPERYRRSILSYDTRLLCFVTLTIEEDKITSKELTKMAESVVLSPAGKQEEDVYSVEEALIALEAELVQNGIVQQGLLAPDGRTLHLSDQLYVTWLGNSRALFVTLEDAGYSSFGEYAVCLDGNGFYQKIDDRMMQLGGVKQYLREMGQWVEASEIPTPEQAQSELDKLRQELFEEEQKAREEKITDMMQQLSLSWTTTWYAMDGPKAGRVEGSPKAHSIVLDLNGDGQKEIGFLCNGNIKYRTDTSVVAFYQLTEDGTFEEYCVLEGFPWLYDKLSFEVYEDGIGSMILHAVRPEPLETGIRYQDCYYTIMDGKLWTDILFYEENTENQIIRITWYDGDEEISPEEYQLRKSGILGGAEHTTTYDLYAEQMESEIFARYKEPGKYLRENLEELLS